MCYKIQKHVSIFTKFYTILIFFLNTELSLI